MTLDYLLIGNACLVAGALIWLLLPPRAPSPHWRRFFSAEAALAPYIGLLATVIHIVQALALLSGSSVDVAMITKPVAAALESTAWGLSAAILASLSFYILPQEHAQR